MWHRISLIVWFCFSSMLLFAQSMTDEQVISFVRQEVESGSDQQTIVSKLLKKGVTPDQLRRIKKKYDAQGSQLGATDLMGGTEQKSGSNRMRTAKERAADELQKKKGFMVRSQSEDKEKKDLPTRE